MSDETKTPQKLTPEQIDNWRNALFLSIGSYALIMPAEEIQRYRDRMQELADASAEEVVDAR